MTTHKKLEPTRSMAYPAILFLLTFAAAGYFSTLGVDTHHDGIMLKPAMDVASGQMLFRDTFTQYGALTTLLQAGALMVFGKYLITIKLLTAFFYALVSVLLYLIFTRFMSKTLVFITVVIWIFMAPYYIGVFHPWSSVYSLFFQLLGAYFLTMSLARDSRMLLLLAGVATGLAFCCRQTVGTLMFMAVLAFFAHSYFLKQTSLKNVKSNFTVYVLGNFIVILVLVSWLLANHALDDWWRQTIVWPLSWSQGSDFGFPLSRLATTLWPPEWSPEGRSFVWTLLPLSTMLLLIYYSIRVLRRSKDVQYSRSVLLLCFIGLASWLQYYPVPCLRHLYWASTPMICLFALLVFRFLDEHVLSNAKTSRAVVSLATIAVILFVCSPNLTRRAYFGYTRIVNQSCCSVDQPQVLRHMRWTKYEMDKYAYVYSQIESYLKDNPQGNVVNLTPDALYNTFDPRIANVHQMYVNWEPTYPDIGSVFPDYHQKTYSYIWENKPLILAIEAIDPSLIPGNYHKIEDSDENSDILIYRAWPEDQK